MFSSLLMDLVDDLLDLFFGSFLLEESQKLSTFGSVWGAVISVLEVGDIFVFLGGDQRMVLRGDSFANALSKGKANLLVEDADQEGLACVLVRECDVVDPATVR